MGNRMYKHKRKHVVILFLTHNTRYTHTQQIKEAHHRAAHFDCEIGCEMACRYHQFNIILFFKYMFNILLYYTTTTIFFVAYSRRRKRRQRRWWEWITQKGFSLRGAHIYDEMCENPSHYHISVCCVCSLSWFRQETTKNKRNIICVCLLQANKEATTHHPAAKWTKNCTFYCYTI